MNFIELTYYGHDGCFSGDTAYKSEYSDAQAVRKELSSMNEAGKLPGIIGRFRGYATFNIVTKRKDSQWLVRLT